ncbi:MAG: hypothetical protein HQ507_05205 [Candidatus Marinimicrobia bacterium]|nr:hypothetical protein [Candidatus Neomarinimicrobiota bacterium]
MKNKNMLRSLLLLLISTFGIVVCFEACDKPVGDIETGYLRVKVTDNDILGTPVPDVEIHVSPGNLTETTDSNGVCEFSLDPGEYNVIADICCVGPSNIHYDEAVTVTQTDTTQITLGACLQCL